MESSEEYQKKNDLFCLVQDYLSHCRTIIWGSGATIPFGMPSMEDLKKELKIKEEGNLEEIFSKKNIEEYEQFFFDIINEKDAAFRKNINKTTFKYLAPLVNYFYKAFPPNFNIITTNYDCILEYLLEYYNWPFTDGFTGREFSSFDVKNFQKTNFINLIKVHGSLRWNTNKQYSYYNKSMLAILPSNNKYEKIINDPFRSLIVRSDKIIEKSKCFLIIGFGFNDKHLTPKLDEALEAEDKKVVIVTKEATSSLKEKLKNAKSFILLEEFSDNKTKFSYYDNEKKEKREENLKGNFWELKGLLEILT